MGLLLGSTAIANVMYGSTAVQKVMHGVDLIYSAGVTAILTNGTNVDISTLFDPGDWANAALKKVVIVPVDVTIGSNDNTLPAMKTGTGRSGILEINFLGGGQGAGGTVANSGVGGNVLLAEEAGVVLIGDGNLWAGGGLGGLGGTGGQGSYVAYSSETRNVVGSNIPETGDPAYYPFYWDSVVKGTSTSGLSNGMGYNVGGFWYKYYGNGANYSYYSGAYRMPITREGNITYYSTGGAPGTQGRGQGYDAAATAGTAGAAGGTNAGTGGASGNGGGWGVAGADGIVGADGNYTLGTAGTVGQAPGYSIVNPGNVDASGFTGSLLGL